MGRVLNFPLVPMDSWHCDGLDQFQVARLSISPPGSSGCIQFDQRREVFSRPDSFLMNTCNCDSHSISHYLPKQQYGSEFILIEPSAVLTTIVNCLVLVSYFCLYTKAKGALKYSIVLHTFISLCNIS